MRHAALEDKNVNLTIIFVVHSFQVDSILKNPQRNDGEGEDVRARFQVPAERLVRIGKSDVGVNAAVDYIPVHTCNVGRGHRDFSRKRFWTGRFRC